MPQTVWGAQINKGITYNLMWPHKGKKTFFAGFIIQKINVILMHFKAMIFCDRYSLQSLYNLCVTKINIKSKLHVYKHGLTITLKPSNIWNIMLYSKMLKFYKICQHFNNHWCLFLSCKLSKLCKVIRNTFSYSKINKIEISWFNQIYGPIFVITMFLVQYASQ